MLMGIKRFDSLPKSVVIKPSSKLLTVKPSPTAMSAAPKAIKQSKAVHAAASRPGCPATPPDRPMAQLSNPFEFAKQIIDTVKLIQTSESKEAPPVAKSQDESNAQAFKPIARASRLEVKEVHEMYVPRTLHCID